MLFSSSRDACSLAQRSPSDSPSARWRCFVATCAEIVVALRRAATSSGAAAIELVCSTRNARWASMMEPDAASSIARASVELDDPDDGDVVDVWLVDVELTLLPAVSEAATN